ncbi:hypothetical protein [Streptosporangium lutulentum]|uniref:DUF4367 domain-containing protein n=1 Tax=Streptosporangium lutulentum TaxID=1461250 RepID=A0ABT9QPR7_9ACTN|nr:hypothetical protein [Streptosporangium lutulentum]MDP9848760.1 hypothetical protein [Streptosporangium lutulentum]
MSNLESELRQAMIEETSALGAPPDLAHQVTRRARRRRRSHLTALAVAAAIAAVAVAVPAYLGGQASDVAAPTPPAVVDGVQVGYLPSGLGTPEQEKVRDGGLPGTRATWGSGDDEVLVTVYRPPVLELGDPEVMLARLKESSGALRGGALVRGRPGLTTLADDDLVWVERPDLVLRVTVGTRHRSDLRAVADGLEPEGRTGGAFEGLLLTYLPAGLHLDGPASANGSWTQMRWSGNDVSMRLLAVRGADAEDSQTLLAWAGTHQRLSGGTPEKVRGKPGYSATLDDPDQRQAHVRLWVEKQGLGYLLAVSRPLAPELDRIVDGIVPAEPATVPGEPVDGVGVTYLPPGSQRTTPGSNMRFGSGWSATIDRWSSSRGDVEVTVARGGVLHTSQWLDEFLLGEKRQSAPVGRAPVGIWTTDPNGRRGAFWVAPGVAVHVKVSPELAGELDRIVAGIRVPGS